MAVSPFLLWVVVIQCLLRDESNIELLCTFLCIPYTSIKQSWGETEAGRDTAFQGHEEKHTLESS